MQRNNYVFGFLLGILIPFVGILLVYMLRYMGKGIELLQFWQLMQDNPRTISSTISLGMIACIPLFTYYKNRRLYKTLYGSFVAVGIYAVIVIVYRFGLI